MNGRIVKPTELKNFQNDQAFQDGKQCQNKAVASRPRSKAGLPDNLGLKMKLRTGL